jgi:heavy metal sensor kinase
MNLTIRARLTALYFAVLALTFVAFFWVSDIGFQRSIEATVDNASRTNLGTVRRLLENASSRGQPKVRKELSELAGLWANGALFEVANAKGEWIFRPEPFLHVRQPLPAIQSDVSFATTNLNDSQYRVALQRVKAGDEIFEIYAAVPTEPFDQALDHFRIIEKEFLPLMVLLASLLGYWLSGRSLAPVNRIIETAELIGAQNLSSRLEAPKARDELRRLTETLNAMLARIDASFKRVTQFTADASHDLRTPVAIMRTSAEVALRRPRSDHEYRQTLLRILATAEETTSLIENLLTLARADAGAGDLHFQPIDLRRSLESAAAGAEILAGGKGITFEHHLPDEAVWISADERATERAVKIILENAVKYTAPEGRITLRFEKGEAKANIEIRDNGIGIAEKDMPHIFERFYRANHVRPRDPGGSGLGLAIALWIVQKHQGKIEVESFPGQGSMFRITLPLAKSPAEIREMSESLA